MKKNTIKFLQETYTTSPFQQIIDKPWGYEIIYTPKDAPAVGKILHVKAGFRLSLQYHDEKIETLCLIKGKGLIILSDQAGIRQEIEMERLKGYYVQPGQVHRVIAITDIDFIESSTPEKGNTFRLEDDNQRGTETEALRQKRVILKKVKS